MRFQILLLAIVSSFTCHAQSKFIKGDSQKKSAQFRDENHLIDYFSDVIVGDYYTTGYAVNGYFIGPFPFGLDKDSIEMRPQDDRSFPLMLRGIGQENDSVYIKEDHMFPDSIIGGVPGSMYVYNYTAPYKNGKAITWLTLDDIRRKYFPEVTGKCVYCVNKFIIPNRESLYKFDAAFLLYVEKLESKYIDVLKDMPPFTFIKIVTDSKTNSSKNYDHFYPPVE